MSRYAWVLSVALLGCTPATLDDEAGEPVEMTSASIVGGTSDVEHRAVVALSGSNGMCTGTIIAKDADVAFALTAAHCCRGTSPGETSALVGDDYTNPTASFDVLSATMDRRYDARQNDFCIVELAGRSEDIQQLAVIPPMTSDEDDLAPGDVVDFVGYGSTHDGTYNTLRRHVMAPIQAVDRLTVEHAQAGAGTCFGDSGGPGVRVANGAERVAVVVSGGGDQCEGVGVAGRVSAVHDDFIVPVVAGQEQQITCGECVAAAVSSVGDCASATKACLEDARCEALVQCNDGCDTDRCREGCAAAHPEALPKYDAITTCLCQSPCAEECADSSICRADARAEEKIATGSDGSTGRTSAGCRVAEVGSRGGASLAVAWLLAGVAISRRAGRTRRAEQRPAA